MNFKFTHSSDIVGVGKLQLIRINSIHLVYTVSNIRAIGFWLILNKFQIQTFHIIEVDFIESCSNLWSQKSTLTKGKHFKYSAAYFKKSQLRYFMKRLWIYTKTCRVSPRGQYSHQINLSLGTLRNDFSQFSCTIFERRIIFID